jgi:hypothetical protein
MHQFMDRITTDQAAAASDAMTKFLVSCAIPFTVADHPSFSPFFKTIRPAYDNYELRPSRRSMANVRLPELYAMTKVLVREAISEWAEFLKPRCLWMAGNQLPVNILLTFLLSLATSFTFWRVSRPDPTGRVRQIKLRLCNA